MRRVIIGCALTVYALCSSPASARETVGAGTAGNVDGPAARATFVDPRGLVFDAAGNLLVADSGGQRIRRVSPSGSVTTIAGSGELAPDRVMVPGGYRDGAAKDARFNRPSSVAVGHDGIVYVADTDNHCIRAIHDGVVTTFAGANERGTLDGPRTAARFVAPTALALDAEGRLFVGDHRNALRVIEHGMVTTLKLPGDLANYFSGIAVWGSGPNERLIVATHLGVAVLRYPALGLEHLYRDEPKAPFSGDDGSLAALHRTIGQPLVVAAIGPQSFLASDPRAHAIRIYDGERSDILAGAGRENSQLDSAGFKGAPDYRFFAPTGIAISDRSELAVADTGNHSVRFLPIPPLRNVLTASSLGSIAKKSTVLVAGDRSLAQIPIFYASLAAALEVRGGPGFSARAYNAGDSLGEQSRSIQAAIRSGTARCIIWLVNADDLNRDLGRPAGTALDPQSTGTLRARFEAAVSLARLAGTPLIAVLVPTPSEASPAAMLWSHELSAAQPAGFDAYAQDEQLLQGLVHGAIAGNAFPALRADQRSINPHLLFGTQDPVLTPFATAMVAEVVQRTLRAAGLGLGGYPK